MASNRITHFLRFSDPKKYSEYLHYEAEKFLKRKSLLLTWLISLCIITIYRNLSELFLNSDNPRLKLECIVDVSVIPGAAFLVGIPLFFLKKPKLWAISLIEACFFLISVASITLMAYQSSTYENVSGRLLLVFASLYIHISYNFVTTRGIYRSLFLGVQAGVVVIFTRDDLKSDRDSFLIQYLPNLILCVIGFWIMTYLMSKSERLEFLAYDDSRQKDRIWKEIFDSMPQGAAIIDQNYNIKFDNPAFQEIFGESDEKEKAALLDKAMNLISLRHGIAQEKYSQFPQQPSGYLETPIDRGDSRRSDFPDNSHIHDNSSSTRKERYYRSFRSIINYVNLSGDPQHRRNSAIRKTHFYTFDSKMKGKNLEIKVARSSFEGNDVILAIFTDITERELISKLNEVNEFKDNLLSSVSHELKTPLNSSMLMIMNSLMYPDLPVEMKQSLTGALANHKRLEMILSDILDYCLLNTKKFDLNLEYFDIFESFKEIKQVFESQAAAKNIQLIAKIGDLPSAFIRSDKKRLLQVLYNLMSNSIKFTQKGSISLSIKEDPAKPKFLRFKIKDTGIGMCEEVQLKLREHLKAGNFEKKVTNNSSGGGLGLYVSNQLASRLGKGITFFSEKDNGSSFYFSIKNFDPTSVRPMTITLPNGKSNRLASSPNRLSSMGHKPSAETIVTTIGDREVFQETPASSVAFDFKSKMDIFSALLSNRKEKSIPSPFKGKDEENTSASPCLPVCRHPQVLIADDDPFNVLSLKTIIKKLGYDSFVGYNGREIIDYVVSVFQEEDQCENCKGMRIIILDCNMPVMDGYQCVRMLKKKMMDETIPTIPVIACTAYVHQDEKALCDNYGFDDFVPKPVDISKLKILFDKYIKNKLYVNVT